MYNPDHPLTQHHIVFQAVSLKGSRTQTLSWEIADRRKMLYVVPQPVRWSCLLSWSRGGWWAAPRLVRCLSLRWPSPPGSRFPGQLLITLCRYGGSSGGMARKFLCCRCFGDMSLRQFWKFNNSPESLFWSVLGIFSSGGSWGYFFFSEYSHHVTWQCNVDIHMFKCCMLAVGPSSMIWGLARN